jgi:hypothetical protein
MSQRIAVSFQANPKSELFPSTGRRFSENGEQSAAADIKTDGRFPIRADDSTETLLGTGDDLPGCPYGCAAPAQMI